MHNQKLPDDILQTMLQHCQQLLMYLQKCVSEVYHSHIPCVREPIIYLECLLQHDESCLPHIRLDRINISEDLVCPKNDHQIIPFETYTLLFTHHLPIVIVHTCTYTVYSVIIFTVCVIMYSHCWYYSALTLRELHC